MKKNTIIYVLLLLFLLGVAFVVLSLSTGRTTFFGKASGAGVFNSTNSYVFASPLSVRAGGDKIRVTVFALDDQGRGVSKKNVMVNCKEPANCQSLGVSITEAQSQTDTLGRALFDVSSSVAGKFELQVAVEGSVIPQTVTVNFQ